jgi:hypothetical protein
MGEGILTTVYIEEVAGKYGWYDSLLFVMDNVAA